MAWLKQLGDWRDGLTLHAAPRTDLFVDPQGGSPVLNATTSLGQPPLGECTFSARVTVPFAATFDAARPLLDLFELEKALYELRYEIDNRPDWVGVPLAGIAGLAGLHE